MPSSALRIVRTAPSTADILRDAIRGRDEAMAVVARLDRIIAEHGRAYIAERYPNQREFVRPSLERLRQELRR
jgi:hypothetical protein